MKYVILFLLLPLFTMGQNSSADETIFKAMEDEMGRTREQLKIPGGDTPFYVSYTLGRARSFAVSGVLGGVVSSLESPTIMQGSVQLLLGDYHRNTSMGELLRLPVNLPIEVDYNSIRRGFWQASDMCYKMALGVLRKKISYEKEHPLSPELEELDDWQKMSGVEKHVEREKAFDINLPAMEDIVKEVSAIFLEYKEIYNTSVVISGVATDVYKITTEGTSLKFPFGIVRLIVKATINAPDGTPLSDVFSLEVDTPGELPPVEELKKQTRDFVNKLVTLSNASCMEEFYSGPVMFEEGAVASMFVLNLLKPGALFAVRTGNGAPTGLAMRFGSKIIDERISVKNYTSLKTYDNVVLDGYYELDMEGVKPIPELVLVENGVFKAMLNGRTPAQYAPSSTGSSRMAEIPSDLVPMTAPGTIHISVNKGTKPDKMKSNLLKMAKAQGKEYAYIVRKVAGPVSEVYRVDVKTGKMTQVRGVNIPFVTLTKLMKLQDISSKEITSNYMYNNACRASLIFPSAITVENFELSKLMSKPLEELELKYPLQR